MTTTAFDVALAYIRRGWAPVPVPFKQKGPVLTGWQLLRLTEQTVAQYFNGGPQNIGVILGPASGNLADVDLDCDEAIAVAGHMLQPTICFGRTTARCAHWLYRVSGVPAGTKAVFKFDDPVKLRTNAKAARLVELRLGGDDKGTQTIFPGSVHESGEPIRWETDCEQPPVDIAMELLRTLVARIAAAALLVRYWPPKGNRHDLSLALGGALARTGWDEAAITAFVGAIVQTAQDPRPSDRVRCARDAAQAVVDGQPAYGYPKLKEIVGDEVARALAGWLGFVPGSSPAHGGPAIQCGADLTAIAEATERALVGAGLPLFRRDTLLVRPVILEARSADNRPIRTVGLATVNTIMMRSFMDQAARFEKFDARSKTFVRCKPPEDIADLILSRTGYWPFPGVRGVLAAPSLRPDGSLLERAGYDAATGMYLMDPPPMPDIPEQPTWQEGKAALDVLDRLLDGFPWDDDDSRAVGISALISPVVRAALPTVPLHAISSPEAGTGKSYLTQLAAAIATGFPCPVIATGKDEEEIEKRLGAALLAGHVLLSIDNVSRPLGGDLLCQLLDQPLIKVRILGKTAGPLVEPRLVLFATGNNLTLFGDIVRRAVVGRMDAACEDPWQRQFAADPLAKILADRGKYIAAALTVCRAFLVSGEPPLPPLASFVPWSRIVRSAVQALGSGDPVRTMAGATAEDPDRQTFGAVLEAWWGTIGAAETSAADLIRSATKRDPAGDYANKDLRDAFMAVAGSKGGEISSQRLGYWLRSHRDRVLGGYVLRRPHTDRTKTALWCVAKALTCR